MFTEAYDTRKQAVGARLRITREARGWSQVNVATMLGISPQRWYTYESGSAMIQPPLLAKFCQVSFATSDWIYFGRAEMLPLELARKIEEIGGTEAGNRA